MHYYIDGYNFLFRLFGKKGTLQEMRNHLIRDINKKIRFLKLEITIVFDATYQEDENSRTHFDNLEIIYTSHRESADDYIISDLESKQHPQREIVITSDNDLARRARRVQAKTQSVEEFMNQLVSSPKSFLFKFSF